MSLNSIFDGELLVESIIGTFSSIFISIFSSEGFEPNLFNVFKKKKEQE